MKIGIIKNEGQYETALARIETLIDDGPANADEREELELLTLVISNYEDVHYPIAPPDPIEAIRFVMEQKGIENDAALAGLVKLTSARISELMNKKRHLTIDHIRRFQRIGVPLESLVAEYELASPGGLREQQSGEE